MADEENGRELEGLIAELGLSRRQADRLRRRWPGRPEYYRGPSRGDMPTTDGPVFAFLDPDCAGLRPPGWSIDDHEKYLRGILGAPTGRVFASGTFAGAAVNETAQLNFQSVNAVFLVSFITWFKSLATADVRVQRVKQAARFDPTVGPAVAIEAVLGSADHWLRWQTIVVPNEGLQVDLIVPTNPGVAHRVDGVIHGWQVGVGKLPQ